jgi:alpha-glucosidase
MPWQAGAMHGGFTTGNPWLPLSAENQARAVDCQDSDANSLLALTRRLLDLRRAAPALRYGSIENMQATGTLLAFDRVNGRARIRCQFNLSAEGLPISNAIGTPSQLLSVNGGAIDYLPPWSALFLAI